MIYLDILLLALVAVFILLRLRSVLGKRIGHERSPERPPTYRPPYRRPQDEAVERPTHDLRDWDRDERVIPFPEDRRAAAPMPPKTKPEAEAGLTAIAAQDPHFDGAEFMQGARQAYEMIVTAFAQGDRQTLRPLLAPDVYRDFAGAIDAREKAGERQETALVSLDDAVISGAALRGRMAEVSVTFQARLISVTKNADGAVVAGHPGMEEKVHEVWTFARDLGSSDPTWQLVGTEALD